MTDPAPDSKARNAGRGRVVVSMVVENYNRERLRAFGDVPAACSYIESLTERLYRLCEANRTKMWLASATVYEVTPTGKLRVFESYDGHDHGDGVCVGWDDEQ